MKRLLLAVILLLTVLLLALWGNDRLNVALILASSGTSTYKTYRLFKAPPKDEIPILGSSRASQNFVPSELSPKAFNYGIDGSGMYETLFLLRQTLRNQAEGLIIINLDPWGFRGNVVPDFKADYRLVLSSPAIRAALPPEKTGLAERLPGLRFYGALRNNLTQWLNAKRAITKRIDAGATLQRLSRTPAEWACINATLHGDTFQCPPGWQSQIDAIYASTRRPIVWVVSPIAPYWRKLYKGTPGLMAFLEEQRRHANVYAIDLYTPTDNYSESEFMDPTHLNLQGAERFTRQLNAELRARSLL